jgi:hypothetical protein
MKDMDLVSVFSMKISCLLKGCLFSIICFGNFVKTQVGIAAWIHIWVFCTDPLAFISVFMPVSY